MEQNIYTAPKRNIVKPIIFGLIVIGGGYALFVYKDKNGNTFYKKGVEYIRNKGMSREQAIAVIEEYAGKKFVDSSGYDTDYLVARAKAIKSKSNSFTVDSKTYDTKSGGVKR